MDLSPEDIDREVKSWHRRIFETPENGRTMADSGIELLEQAWRHESLRPLVEQIRSHFRK
jgi:hypothetical protein